MSVVCLQVWNKIKIPTQSTSQNMKRANINYANRSCSGTCILQPSIIFGRNLCHQRSIQRVAVNNRFNCTCIVFVDAFLSLNGLAFNSTFLVFKLNLICKWRWSTIGVNIFVQFSLRGLYLFAGTGIFLISDPIPCN